MENGSKFPPTRWSVIDAARSTDPAEQGRALETLFAAYWKPVYKYVRLRWNRPAEDAQDLTQGFFAELLERDLLAKYDPAKSRLRTYLRLCVDSFVMNQEKAAHRQKRGGTAIHLALDFPAAEGELAGATIDPAAIPSPESLEEFFEKEWIRSLFALAVEGLRQLCQERERDRTFRLFEKYDLAGDPDISYEKLAQEYAIPVTDVTNALSWARREFRRSALARRLNREAHVLARLEHPGIVPVHDVGTLADGRVFYAMKFVEGQRLDKHIESVPSLPDRLRLFLRICDAVAFAHACGVLHRDLKPANVMVGAFGEVLVMDWGLAKILRDSAPSEAPADPDAAIVQTPNALLSGSE